jgi:hypothetical protein
MSIYLSLSFGLYVDFCGEVKMSRHTRWLIYLVTRGQTEMIFVSQASVERVLLVSDRVTEPEADRERIVNTYMRGRRASKCAPGFISSPSSSVSVSVLFFIYNRGIQW